MSNKEQPAPTTAQVACRGLVAGGAEAMRASKTPREKAEIAEDLLTAAHASAALEKMSDAQLADVVLAANGDVSVLEPLSAVLDEVVGRLRRREPSQAGGTGTARTVSVLVTARAAELIEHARIHGCKQRVANLSNKGFYETAELLEELAK